MLVLALALVLIAVMAALVLLAVAYPYRGRSMGRAPWLSEKLGSVIAWSTSQDRRRSILRRVETLKENARRA